MNKKNKMKKNNKKNNKKKNIFSLLFLFLLLAIVAGIIFKTDFFYIKKVEILNNYILSDEYIINKTNLDHDDNIFLVNLKNIKTDLEKETYVKTVDLKRKLPDKIIIDVKERIGQIAYIKDDSIFLLDFDGIILKEIKSNEIDNYFQIKSDIDTYEIIGKKILLNESKLNMDKIIQLSEYIYKKSNTLDCKILLKDDNIYSIIDKSARIKYNINEDLEYQFEFGTKILETRANNNESINGIIDFSKSENPIYIDSKDLEESN